MAEEQRVGNIIRSKAVKIIIIEFKTSKGKAPAKQFLVKIPKKIADRLRLSKDNKILFELREDDNKKLHLYMELI